MQPVTRESEPCGRCRQTANHAADGELGPPNRLAFGGHPLCAKPNWTLWVFNQLQISFSTREKKNNREWQARPGQKARAEQTDRTQQTTKERAIFPSFPSFCPVAPSLLAVGSIRSVSAASIVRPDEVFTSVSKTKLFRCGLPLALLAIVPNLFSLALDFLPILPILQSFLFSTSSSSHIFIYPQKTNNYRHQSTPTVVADAEGVFCEDLSKTTCTRFPSSKLLCAPFY
jgi:hypothetical protein